MHLFRLFPAGALGLILLSAAAPARADDAWSPLFPQAHSPAPVGPVLSSRSYWKPVPAWRTIVIPQAQAEPVRELEPSWAKTATAATAAATLAPASHTKPLTGYAHELAGLASYYWQEQMTSSGERFDKRAMTAAHKTLPLGTRVKVTNLTNGKSTIVRINDRGPFKPGRIIDLSEAAAEQISMTSHGLARVAIEVVR